MPFSKILVAVDGGEDALAGAKMALALAAGCKKEADAKPSVWFVYVETKNYIVDIFGGKERIKKSRSPFDDILLEQARTEQIGYEVLGEIIALGKQDPHSECHTKVLSGNPSTELVNEINGGGYDLAILGRMGASKAQRQLLGTCVDPVISMTSIPVLVVNK